MRIYIASKVKHAPRWLALRDRGAPIISTWIDEWQEGASKDISDLWRRCVDEAYRADFLIAYREEGERFKGALVEIGAALAGGAGVILVGHFSPNKVGRWIEHDKVGISASIEDALAILGIHLAEPKDPEDRAQFSLTERRAIGFYAVLARDPGDFVEMVAEADVETLNVLLEMLTKENQEHDSATRELNAIGAKVVRGALRSRGQVAP